MSETAEVLKARGSIYGDFSDNARVVQGLMIVAASGIEWAHLNDVHREAIHMIFHKIGRIVNGEPNHRDSWIDIAGYAQLVADRIGPQPAKKVDS